MGQHGPPWKGESKDENGKPAKLQDAIEDAWNRAKADGASAGTFLVTEIKIETRNPIHAYIVTIDPTGP